MVDVTVKSADVANLVWAIRRHADAKAIRSEMYRGLNSASKPIRAAMVAEIPNALPRGGGLAAQMQAAVGKGTTGAARGGVQIRFRAKGYDIRTLSGGRIRHPVYGNRLNWVTQTAGVNPEAFTGEFEQQRPAALREVSRVMDEIARKVTNI